MPTAQGCAAGAEPWPPLSARVCQCWHCSGPAAGAGGVAGAGIARNVLGKLSLNPWGAGMRE